MPRSNVTALENGGWPAGVVGGVVPTGMTGCLPEFYTEASPMGGNYGWSGPSGRIVLQNTSATTSGMQKVDAILDDGDPSTGDFTMSGANCFWHLH
ncbi:MAG: hypothetical protein EXS43_00325 [Opitutus sp.]|nr:hypothetical protein [Opitutus sp.]